METTRRHRVGDDRNAGSVLFVVDVLVYRGARTSDAYYDAQQSKRTIQILWDTNAKPNPNDYEIELHLSNLELSPIGTISTQTRTGNIVNSAAGVELMLRDSRRRMWEK